MVLNKAFACASSARATGTLVVPPIAATARMSIHVFALLVNFLPARRMTSSTVLLHCKRRAGQQRHAFGRGLTPDTDMDHGATLVL
jgi:hypothetical protein